MDVLCFQILTLYNHVATLKTTATLAKDADVSSSTFGEDTQHWVLSPVPNKSKVTTRKSRFQSTESQIEHQAQTFWAKHLSNGEPTLRKQSREFEKDPQTFYRNIPSANFRMHQRQVESAVDNDSSINGEEIALPSENIGDGTNIPSEKLDVRSETFGSKSC